MTIEKIEIVQLGEEQAEQKERALARLVIAAAWRKWKKRNSRRVSQKSVD